MIVCSQVLGRHTEYDFALYHQVFKPDPLVLPSGEPEVTGNTGAPPVHHLDRGFDQLVFGIHQTIE